MCALFSPEILQAVAVEGLKSRSHLSTFESRFGLAVRR